MNAWDVQGEWLSDGESSVERGCPAGRSTGQEGDAHHARGSCPAERPHGKCVLSKLLTGWI